METNYRDKIKKSTDFRFNVRVNLFRIKHWRQVVLDLRTMDVHRYHVGHLCELLGVTKQAYYKYDEKKVLNKIAEEEFVIQFVSGAREHDPCLGGKKLWHMYRKDFDGNNPVGRDRFEDILDKYNLKLRKKKRKPRTTDSRHGLPTYPNQAKSYIPTQVNRLWVSDITYIPIYVSESKHIFCYLSLILDAYSKEIVGWAVGETLETSHCIHALRMALGRVDDTSGKELIHHSDRGCQYASKEYTSLLKEYGITISMTENGNPKDNVQAERINNTMKNELLKGKVFYDIKEVTKAVEKAVLFYNTARPHMSVNMMTPQEAATHTGEIKKGWTSYRDIAIKNLQTENIILNKCLSLGA